MDFSGPSYPYRPFRLREDPTAYRVLVPILLVVLYSLLSTLTTLRESISAGHPPNPCFPHSSLLLRASTIRPQPKSLSEATCPAELQTNEVVLVTVSSQRHKDRYLFIDLNLFWKFVHSWNSFPRSFTSTPGDKVHPCKVDLACCPFDSLNN